MFNSSNPEGENTTSHDTSSASSNHPITDDIKIGMTSVYAVIFAMGLFGNAIGLRLTCRKTNSRSVANILISNMATADLLVTLFSMPLSVRHLYVEHDWFGGIIGDVTCPSVQFFSVVPIAASIITILVVSIDKFYAVCYPLRRRLFKKAKMMRTFIWIASVILMSPHLLFWRNMEDPSHQHYHCVQVWIGEDDMVNLTKSYQAAKCYYVIAFVCFYAAPLSIIAVLHVLIARRLWAREVPGNSSRNKEARARENRKALKLLSAIVIAFAFVWLPCHIMHFYIFFDHQKYKQIHMVVMYVAFLISHANSVVNPCLYILFNGKFRRDFIASLKIRYFFKNKSQRRQ